MHTKTRRPLVLIACLLSCQTAFPQAPGPGTLLIATQALEGSLFEETVMLVVHHDDDGSIALMINRPTNLAPDRVFPDVEGAASYTGTLYFGGPLAPTRAFVLSRRSEAIAGASIRIVDDVYLSGDASLLSSLEPLQLEDSFTRIYAGSAQWGPGQLVAEIDAGAWETTIGNVGTIFSATPEQLWQRLIVAPRGTDVAALGGASASLPHMAAAR